MILVAKWLAVLSLLVLWSPPSSDILSIYTYHYQVISHIFHTKPVISYLYQRLPIFPILTYYHPIFPVGLSRQKDPSTLGPRPGQSFGDFLGATFRRYYARCHGAGGDNLVQFNVQNFSGNHWTTGWVSRVEVTFSLFLSAMIDMILIYFDHGNSFLFWVRKHWDGSTLII